MVSMRVSCGQLNAATPLVFSESNDSTSRVETNVLKTVSCVFKGLNQQVSMVNYPVKRAKRELARHRIDLIFPVGQAQSSVGELSAAISIEKWYWLTNFQSHGFKDELIGKRVGVVAASAAHLWVLEQQLPVTTKVKSIKQLLNMFLAGRVDAVVVDRNHLSNHSNLYRTITAKPHFWNFIKFEPKFVEFSSKTLQRQPNLLTLFNQHIEGCDPSSINLLANEKSRLEDYLQPALHSITKYLLDVEHLPSLATQFETSTVEASWQQQLKRKGGPLYDYLLTSNLAMLLKGIQRNASLHITEIMLIDAQGYNIAVSQPTSDVYQGDEEKFFNSFPKGNNVVYVGKLQFDQSTQTYQSQVSFVLSNGNKPIGVVTFGVDVGKILRAF